MTGLLQRPAALGVIEDLAVQNRPQCPFFVDRRQAGPVVRSGGNSAQADALDVVGPALLSVPRVVPQSPSHLGNHGWLVEPTRDRGCRNSS